MEEQNRGLWPNVLGSWRLFAVQVLVKTFETPQAHPEPLPQIRSKKMEVPTLDEHTAIEVGLVDPLQLGLLVLNGRTHLTAMAKEARMIFKEGQIKLGEADRRHHKKTSTPFRHESACS
jgi:hypothetical protein